jgi:hypothetical protein
MSLPLVSGEFILPFPAMKVSAAPLSYIVCVHIYIHVAVFHLQLRWKGKNKPEIASHSRHNNRSPVSGSECGELHAKQEHNSSELKSINECCHFLIFVYFISGILSFPSHRNKGGLQTFYIVT